MTGTQRDQESLISINHRVKKSYLIAIEHIPWGEKAHPEVMEKGHSIPCLWLAGWSYQLCWLCKAQYPAWRLLPTQATFGTAQGEDNRACHRSRLPRYKKKPHTEQYFASKPCTWQGRSMEWGGANRHRTEHHPGFSCKHKSVSVSKQAQPWLAASIRINLHADVWIFRPFEVTSLHMLMGCFPRKSCPRGLGSVESRSCSASGRMIISATFMPGVAACPGHPSVCSATS